MRHSKVLQTIIPVAQSTSSASPVTFSPLVKIHIEKLIPAFSGSPASSHIPELYSASWTIFVLQQSLQPYVRTGFRYLDHLVLEQSQIARQIARILSKSIRTVIRQTGGRRAIEMRIALLKAGGRGVRTV